jgi:hypothetical protein
MQLQQESSFVRQRGGWALLLPTTVFCFIDRPPTHQPTKIGYFWIFPVLFTTRTRAPTGRLGLAYFINCFFFCPPSPSHRPLRMHDSSHQHQCPGAPHLFPVFIIIKSGAAVCHRAPLICIAAPGQPAGPRPCCAWGSWFVRGYNKPNQASAPTTQQLAAAATTASTCSFSWKTSAYTCSALPVSAYLR